MKTSPDLVVVVGMCSYPPLLVTTYVTDVVSFSRPGIKYLFIAVSVLFAVGSDSYWSMMCHLVGLCSSFICCLAV